MTGNNTSFIQEIRSERSFPATAWTQICLSQGCDPQAAAAAVGRLIANYWHPITFFLGRKGLMPEEAEDLTQDFFTHFLEKDIVAYADRSRGRFRNFLLSAVSRFLALKRRRASWRRRPHLSLNGNAEEGDKVFEPVDEQTPEFLFARSWAKRLLNLCVERLRSECESSGRPKQFAVFSGRILEHPSLPAADLAQQLSITTVDVANYQRRTCEHFRNILREEVRQWVASEQDVDAEVRYMLELFSGK